MFHLKVKPSSLLSAHEDRISEEKLEIIFRKKKKTTLIMKYLSYTHLRYTFNTHYPLTYVCMCTDVCLRV